MIRIKGIIAVVVLAGAAFAAYYFLSDQFVEELIEGQATNANGALVEIDNLQLDLLNVHASWDRIQVTNSKKTMENLFETGKAEFDFDIWPFVFGNKVVIENMQVSEFKLNSERAYDGYVELPEKEVEEEDTEPGFVEEIGSEVTAEIKANAEAKFDGITSKINADSLVAALDLVSITKMDSLKNSISDSYARWDSTIKSINLRKDADNIEKTALAIDLEKIKDVKTATKTIDTVNKLIGQVDSVKTGLVDTKKNFQNDLKVTKNSVGQIDNWIREDYETAQGLAKLPKIDAQNIGQSLFGEELLGDFNTYLGYAATAREYLTKLKGEPKEKVERFKGKDYNFSDKYDAPGMWIKNIELSGFTNGDLKLAGKVTDITSDQKKINKATLINLSGTNAEEVGVVVTGELNYLEEEPRETFEARYQKFSLVNQKLSPSALVPYDIAEGTGTISAKLDLIDRRIRSEVSYVADDLKFDFASAGRSKNRLEDLIRSALGSASAIDATAIVDGTAGKLNLKVRSNIDDLFLNALRSTISKEVEQAKAKIQAEVDKQVNDKKAEVESFVADQEAALRSEYDQLEAQVNEQLAIVDTKKKELEAKKKELENSLIDKGKKLLKKKIDF